jgi:LmbE family N-acetylglucosaminyl deacetylase
LFFALSCGAVAAERTILAIGAHAGDMELTAGAVLARHARLKDRVVILHLTLGEGGNPKLDRSVYAEQKRKEAIAAAKSLGAEVMFGPYKDGELPRTEEASRYVAGVIRDVRPSHVITHWKNSIHKDHAAAHIVVNDAVLLASLSGHRGVRGVYFAENWEDAEGFSPYVFVDVSADVDAWRESVKQYEFVAGKISSFAYLDYYEGLLKIRGALSRKSAAVAFDIDPLGKKRILDALP